MPLNASEGACVLPSLPVLYGKTLDGSKHCGTIVVTVVVRIVPDSARNFNTKRRDPTVYSPVLRPLP